MNPVVRVVTSFVIRNFGLKTAEEVAWQIIARTAKSRRNPEQNNPTGPEVSHPIRRFC